MKKESIIEQVVIKESVESVKVIETTIYNKAPELLKLECNNCGGTLELLDKTHAKCPHCGQDYAIDEAGNVSFDLTVDCGDSGDRDEMNRSIKGLLVTMAVFLAVVVCIVMGIVSFNVGARG